MGKGRERDKQGRQEVGAQDSREVITETANHGLGLKRHGGSSRTVFVEEEGGGGGEDMIGRGEYKPMHICIYMTLERDTRRGGGGGGEMGPQTGQDKH